MMIACRWVCLEVGDFVPTSGFRGSLFSSNILLLRLTLPTEKVYSFLDVGTGFQCAQKGLKQSPTFPKGWRGDEHSETEASTVL